MTTPEPTSIRLHGILKHSLVNGPGIRFVVFVQGCFHNCPGCHNPDSHDPNGGYIMSLSQLAGRMASDKKLDGLTLSGGEPMLQANACRLLAREAHIHGLSVWCYTGYLYEDIASGSIGPDAQALLQETDVLVDGPFQQNLASETCLFRGSTNQRLVDVPASLAAGKCVIYSEGGSTP